MRTKPSVFMYGPGQKKAKNIPLCLLYHFLISPLTCPANCCLLMAIGQLLQLPRGLILSASAHTLKADALKLKKPVIQVLGKLWALPDTLGRGRDIGHQARMFHFPGRHRAIGKASVPYVTDACPILSCHARFRHLSLKFQPWSHQWLSRSLTH